MNLNELIERVPGIHANGTPTLEVAAVTADSRQVGPGDLFVAIRGTSDDGHRYLSSAERAGAVVALGQEPDPGLGIPYLQADDSRLAYAHLAAAWHGFPAREMIMVGITGTDGKTTTAAMLFDILQRAGIAVGLISTVSAQIGAQALDTGLHVTTPDPMDLQALLRNMVAADTTHCILETTSHGLAQHRVAATEFDIGVVTNVTHEHLDFHGTYEAYREAKGRLIAGLSDAERKPGGPDKVAVLNVDDEAYTYLRDLVRVRAVGYGLSPKAELRASAITAGSDGLSLKLKTGERSLDIDSPLLGEYNVSNILAAFAAANEALGVDSEIAVKAIREFAGIPGRMERIDLGQRFMAIVDFAHTPNALRVALETARTLADGRVISVFGSAGLRDRAKRRLMAEISAELADISLITAEDPRTEPLDDILEEMGDGAKSKGAKLGERYELVPDRGQAIERAVELAEPGDLVIACGKGHEQSMCFGETEYPWDDRTAMRAALAKHLGVAGPQMPVLPTSNL